MSTKTKKSGLGSTMKIKQKKATSTFDQKRVDKMVETLGEEKIKRIIVEVPESLHHKVKLRAYGKHLTMKTYIISLLEDDMLTWRNMCFLQFEFYPLILSLLIYWRCISVKNTYCVILFL